MKGTLSRRLRLVVGFALLCWPALKAEAQASGHQRIGVERSADWELAFELSGGMNAAELDAVDLFFFDSAASVDLTVAQRWLASINLPFFARSAIGDGVGQASAAGLGDLGLSLGWTRRFADARITASLNLTAPSGYWSEHPDEEERLISGSGRWFLDGQLSASSILDPVVLSAAFAYEIGFPEPRED